MAAADGRLHIYFLNVGQGDTTVIVTPQGRVIVIDAARPAKLSRFLLDIGAAVGTDIDLLVITHPHSDHYSGAGRMVRNYRVLKAVFCPFWNAFGMGPLVYRQLVNDLHRQGAHCQFLSGYARFYPDTLSSSPTASTLTAADCCLELLGPTNELVASLEQQKLFDTNHLSIMSRINWQGLSVIIAADAQMENWAVFDNERMATNRNNILRAAHHGSGNGTQWERLKRLKPEVVVVSSDLEDRHRLPDVAGSAIFARYARDARKPLVAITGDSGSIEVIIDNAGHKIVNSFGETRAQNVVLANRVNLTRQNNPTDWKSVLIDKANAL
jgi:competence protein ComEC